MRLGVAGVAAVVVVVALVLVIESGGGRWSEKGLNFRGQEEASDPVAPSIEDRIPATPSANQDAVEREVSTAEGEETDPGEELLGAETDTEDSPSPRESPRVTALKLRLNAIVDWDEFYSVARTNKANYGLIIRDYQKLVIDRVARELGLDAERAKVLRNLIHAEQMEVTNVALKRYGDWWALKLRAASGDKSMWKELRELRRDIREDYESLYSKVFAEEELKVINRHLRNDKVRLQGGPGGYLVGGVGE